MDLAIDARWTLDETFSIRKNWRIIIEDSQIIYAGPRGKTNAQIAGHEKFEYPHGLCSPAFFNAHTHIPESLIRGICDDATLHKWLFDYVWKIEPQMKKEDAYIGTLLGCIEMVATGTIGFCDQYFYSDSTAKGAFDFGLKAFICPSIFFDGNPESESMEEAFLHAKTTFDKWNSKDGRIFVGFGPHAPYTVNKEWLLRINEAAIDRQTKIHTHLSETQYEVQQARKNWNQSPIEYVEGLGLLENCLAAHCIHLSDNDIALLAKYQVPVLHCIQSNLKIGAGIAPIPKLLDSGIPICLGTDGQASNNNLSMLEEIRLEALIHKGLHNNPELIDARTALKMATINANSIFPDPTIYKGTIAIGNPADITVINFNSPNTIPVLNPLSNLVYAAESHNFALTVCNGTVVYDNGAFPTCNNVSNILEQAQKIAERMISQSERSDEFDFK